MHSRAQSIHRSLVVRLLILAVLLCLAVGTFVYFSERSRISEWLADRTSVGIEFIRSEVRHLLKDGSESPQPSIIQAALENAAATMPRSDMGRYVFVTIHEAQSREEWARLAAPLTDYPQIDEIVQAMSKSALRFPERDIVFDDSLEIGPRPLVHVASPVFYKAGKRVAYINGVFAFSEKAVATTNQRIARAVGIAAGIVLLTTVLLYPMILNLLRRLSQLSIRLLDSNLATIQVLGSAIAKRDSDTDAHNYRVTIYSVRLAEKLGLGANTVRSLVKGAFLHDVGKIGIRDNILLKPGRLTEEEFEEMKKHVPYGLDIVGGSDWLRDAADVVGYHHSKVDGSGYPSGKDSNAIPITARIFAIVDVFDALTSERPYKKPMSFEDTMGILEEGAGSHFDPPVLNAFADIAPELYAEFARAGDEKPRQELDRVMARYFKGDIGSLME